jgi:hypothetical protein
MNETNEVHEEPRESIDDRQRKGMIGEEERGDRLTTKDMAAGIGAKRAREEPHVTADSQKVEAPDRQDAGHPGVKPPPASPLFQTSETETFRARWNAIQTQFVDEPRRSVEQADELVAATMKRLAVIFGGERDKLEKEWDRGEDISTEDLRIALQRYRSFFDRLLSV